MTEEKAQKVAEESAETARDIRKFLATKKAKRLEIEERLRKA